MINDRIELTIENHISHVCLSRADKMNSLDKKMLEAIPLVGEKLRSDSSIRVVIVSGDGGNFCAGLDKSNFSAMLNQKQSQSVPKVLAERSNGIANSLQYVVWMWRELPIPVIAAVDGFALGGGLQIALGADFRYASKNSRYSILELKWGLIPDMSSTQIMRHIIRDDVIRELTYTARLFSAQEAKEWGFVTEIVDDPLVHSMAIAKDIVQKNPDAIRAAKRVIDNANYQTAAQGLLMESVEQDVILGSSNQIEAVMAQLEKRPAVFKD